MSKRSGQNTSRRGWASSDTRGVANDAPPTTRGFFTTPSWVRAALSMSGLLGFAGIALGGTHMGHTLTRDAGPEVGFISIGVVMLLTGIAALTTWIRGVRAWRNEEPMSVNWYWPGLAAGVIQGATCSGGLAFDYFLGNSLVSSAEPLMIGLTMLTLAGVPFLGALCCGGAWWTERYADDGEPLPELR